MYHIHHIHQSISDYDGAIVTKNTRVQHLVNGYAHIIVHNMDGMIITMNMVTITCCIIDSPALAILYVFSAHRLIHHSRSMI